MAAWREEDHPRDARGRWVRKGSAAPAVPIGKTLANLTAATDDDLLDVFTRVSGRSRLDRLSRAQLDALDKELARRDGSTLLEDVDDTPEQRKIDDLVARGWSYAEAFSDVYGTKAGTSAARDAVDADRRKGETREQTLRRQYQEVTYLTMLQAEEWTRGNLLSRAGKAAGIAPASLFSGPRNRARKYGSEELARFWAEVAPRQTYQEWRAARVGGTKDRRKAQAAALAGSGRDFGL